MRSAACILFVGAGFAAVAQKPEVGPTFKGTFLLPVAIGNDLFSDITEMVGQLDGCVQMPLYKGLGLGVGYSGTWLALKEFSLSPDIIRGDVVRSTWYGKVQYEHYTGPTTYYELNAKFGGSSFAWKTEGCPDIQRQQAFHWGLQAGYYIHASDMLSFGLTLGYEADEAPLSSDLLCMDTFTGRGTSQVDDPYRFLTIGIGFSARLVKP